MKLEDRGLIFDATRQPPAERVAAFVSLYRLASGSLLCGFQLGPRKHDVASTLRFYRSTDDGIHWHPTTMRFATAVDGFPGSLASGEVVELPSGELLLYATWFDRSDPRRPLFDPETQGILHSKQLLAESTDDGETWSDWRELSIPGLRGCSSTGPILVWPDGRIAIALESHKEYDDAAPATHGAWILISEDGGRSFMTPRLVAQHPEHRIYYWDQRLCRGSTDNDIVAMFWAHDLTARRDLNVHFRQLSLDDGAFASSPITDSGIAGQIAAPLVLDDSHIVAFVVDRTVPRTMKLWQSSDGGVTWPPEDALLIYEHDEQAKLTQGTGAVDYVAYWDDMAKWSFGHPAIRSLDDNRLVLAYYAGTPDCLSVHWARVRTDVGHQ